MTNHSRPHIVALTSNHSAKGCYKNPGFSETDPGWWLCFILTSITFLAIALILLLSYDLNYWEDEEDSVRVFSKITDTIVR